MIFLQSRVQKFFTVAEQLVMMECDPPLGEEGGAKRRSAQKLIERWVGQVWSLFCVCLIPSNSSQVHLLLSQVLLPADHGLWESLCQSSLRLQLNPCCSQWGRCQSTSPFQSIHILDVWCWDIEFLFGQLCLALMILIIYILNDNEFLRSPFPFQIRAPLCQRREDEAMDVRIRFSKTWQNWSFSLCAWFNNLNHTTKVAEVATASAGSIPTSSEPSTSTATCFSPRSKGNYVAKFWIKVAGK